MTYLTSIFIYEILMSECYSNPLEVNKNAAIKYEKLNVKETYEVGQDVNVSKI